MPFDESRPYPSPTGASLYVYTKRPAGRPIGVVQVNHGLAEHALRYARFADALAEAGFLTVVHDHRGHGRTTAPDAPRGVYAAADGARLLIADIDAVHDLIAAEAPGLPVIAFGHSAGGLAALNYVLAHSDRLAGAAIWNANFSAGLAARLARVLLAWERFRLGSDVPSRLLPRLTFRAWARQMPDRRTDFDWLSRDAAEVDAYVADPLCGFDASVSLWGDLFDLIEAGADDASFAAVRRDLPFNLVGGAADPSTFHGRAVEALAARLRRLGFSNLISTIYPETRHESLNELNRNLITAEFVAWARRVVEAA